MTDTKCIQLLKLAAWLARTLHSRQFNPSSISGACIHSVHSGSVVRLYVLAHALGSRARRDVTQASVRGPCQSGWTKARGVSTTLACCVEAALMS